MKSLPDKIRIKDIARLANVSTGQSIAYCITEVRFRLKAAKKLKKFSKR